MTCSSETSIGGTADFIIERRYLKNVTTKTLAWYSDSFKALDDALESLEGAKSRIVELGKRGVSPISVSIYLRCINDTKVRSEF